MNYQQANNRATGRNEGESLIGFVMELLKRPQKKRITIKELQTLAMKAENNVEKLEMILREEESRKAD